ncbi:MAG: radical SAM/SPASM domain-containing protein [Clostridium sp.]
MKWNIGWGTVSSCNMKCGFCYSKNVRKESNDLGYDDWRKFIDENYQYINAINYGTGENSISDDWFKLINYINSKYQIEQALTTNGFISERIKNDKNLENIFLKSIKEVDVSLDFANKDRHNSLRGQVNAYDWAINTLEFCSKNNITTTIVFLGTNETLEIQNLEGLFNVAKKYKCKLRMNLFRPTHGINENSKKYIADFESIIKGLEFINNEHKILAIDDPLFGSLLIKNYKGVDPSGSQSLRVLGDGSITPSTYLISKEFIIGNISEKNILSKIDCQVDFEKLVPESCLECTNVNSCKGGVLDRRVLWYGSFNAADPYCHKKLNLDNEIKQIELEEDVNFESIHHGYLPTMFFKY